MTNKNCLNWIFKKHIRKKMVFAKDPYSSSNVISRLFLWWTQSLFRKGYTQDLTEEDMYCVLPENSCQMLGDRLEKSWNKELERAKSKSVNPSLLRAIVKVFWLRFFLYGILMMVDNIVIRCASPFFLGELVLYFSEESEITTTQVYLISGALIFAIFIDTILRNHFLLWGTCIGMRVRLACSSLIYRKALRLNRFSVEQSVTGKIVNLLSNDVSRFENAGQLFHWIWVGILQLCVVAYVSWKYIGISALAGLAVLFLCTVPIQGSLGYVAALLRKKIALCSDSRLMLMMEIVAGIKVIKMYAWEQPFAGLVAKARKNEVSLVKWAGYLKAFFFSSIAFSERVANFIMLLTYFLLGHYALPYQVYAIAQYLSFLNVTLALFYPLAVSSTAESLVSISRLQDFLMQEECTTAESCYGVAAGTGHVSLIGANAKWRTGNEVLKDISLEAAPGQLCAIIGAVGSGKTSLLHALLGELPLNSGMLCMRGKVSYSSQEPWIFIGSVRQNILFEQSYNANKYQQVVHACALQKDFDLFSNGDQTLVGEKGLMLSGGQRARINLARAVYHDADIYLLDDPLSAVDTVVGKHLFDECINGYLKTKTRILVTHQLQYLMTAEIIYVLDKGQIQSKGDANTVFASEQIASEMLTDSKKLPKEMANTGITSSDCTNLNNGRAKTNESVQSGITKISHYWQYLRAGGGYCFMGTVLLLLALAQIIRSFSDIWLGIWTNANAQHMEASSKPYLGPELYIGVYGCLVIVSIILTWGRTILLSNACVTASKKLHDTMFRAIFGTTMQFFDTNPSGNILNRFSKDIGVIDEILPTTIIWMIQIFLTIFGGVFVIILINYYLILPVFIVGGLVILAARFMSPTPKRLKALEARAHSEVLSHLSDSFQGMATIRALGAQKQAQQEFHNHQDFHSSVWFWYVTTSAAFSYCFDMLIAVFTTLIVITFIILGQEQIDGAYVGLAITQSMMFTGMLQTAMLKFIEMVSQMTSVSRVMEYFSLEQEPVLESQSETQPPTSWPSMGAVEFKGVTLRYTKNGAPVLKDLNFSVKPRHKVGIVGRTGAGKSSLVAALFRLTPVDGSVIIDSLDTGHIRLQDIRRHITIIPQEPFLFSGTLRFNLDPFQEFQDAMLWNALSDVELKVNSLDWEISDGGGNMSMGERQLVCLARAVLRNNQLLVLDEATANVDPETDEIIQKTIRRKFKDCTVMTVAHRLGTIIDSDMVLVMDAGTCIEYDHPHNLLQNHEGYFFRMVQETGCNMAEQLAIMAEKAYWNGNSIPPIHKPNNGIMNSSTKNISEKDV